jgi:hypothetical protein
LQQREKPVFGSIEGEDTSSGFSWNHRCHASACAVGALGSGCSVQKEYGHIFIGNFWWGSEKSQAFFLSIPGKKPSILTKPKN